MKYVAVEGCKIDVKEDNITFTNFSITTPASQKVSVDGNGVYFGDLTVSVSGIVYQKSYAVSNSVVFTISPTAKYVSSDGDKVVLENDESATVTGIVGIKTPQDTQTFSMTISIKSAGQSVTSAE